MVAALLFSKYTTAASKITSIQRLSVQDGRMSENNPPMHREERGFGPQTPQYLRVIRVFFAAIPGRWPARALPTTGCPQPSRPRSGCARTVHRPARAAKAPLQRSPGSHRTRQTTVSQLFHRQPAPGRAHQKPPQSRNRPARNPTSLAPPESKRGLQTASPEACY